MSLLKKGHLGFILFTYLTLNGCDGLSPFDGETFRSVSDVLDLFDVIVGLETVSQGAELAEDIDDEIKVAETTSARDSNVCVTPGCAEAALSILENMDRSVAPCDDFYQFACGKFNKSHVITKQHFINVFTEVTNKVSIQLRGILEQPIHDKEPRPFALAKTLYKSCMDQKRIVEVGFSPMKSLFRSIGGWPLVEGDKWQGDSFDWWSSAIKFREAGYSSDYFLTLAVNPNPRNNSVRMIELSGAFFDWKFLDFAKKSRGKIRDPYDYYLVDIAVEFGANQTKAAKELHETAEFSHKLQRLSIAMSAEEKRHAYNPMSVGELQRQFPSIPWREYIEKLMSPEVKGVTDDEIVNVKELDYLRSFEEIIRDTPKRVQANYAASRALLFFMGYFNFNLQTRFLDLGEAEFESRKKPLAWQNCVSVVEQRMSLAVGSMYVTKHFQTDSRKPILQIVHRIREETYKLLFGLDWMDLQTRLRAFQKTKSIMPSNIGYPDEILDIQKLEEFYAKLEIKPKDYIESILNLNKFETDLSYSRLKLPVNRTDWITRINAAEPAARYIFAENSIQISAAYIQDFVFFKDRPNYLNYGSLGSTIGHEFVRAFDSEGQKYDKDGNLIDWWEPVSTLAFKRKAQCIVNQYNNYTVPEVGLKLNGTKTIDENIADNVGYKLSYSAYTEWTGENDEPEPKLPGLEEYSPEQMFWIAAANLKCSKYERKGWEMAIAKLPHSPESYRILGSFSNSEEFIRDFNCPVGSVMNPVHKCQL